MTTRVEPARAFAGYTDEDVPLRGYAALITGFATATGSILVAASRRGLPDRIAPADLALLAVGTYHLSRLLKKEKVPAVMRAPFAHYEGRGAPGEVEERPRGHGVRLAAGELLTCPYCTGQWVALGMVGGLLVAPRVTRTLASVLAVSAASDVLQILYKAADRLRTG